MYASRTTQFIVGIFALLGIAALVILSVSLGKISIIPTPGYTLYAYYNDISGLKTGDQVQVAGVQIGKVEQIGIKDYRARVALRINEGVPIDDDSIASVMTSGIIGDKYVSIQPGSSEKLLRDGGTIPHTQDAFNIEAAVGSFINNAGGGGGSNSSDKDQKSSSADSNSNSNCNCADTNVAKKPGKSGK